MKSLRKTTIAVCTLLTPAVALLVNAQAPRQSEQPGTQQRGASSASATREAVNPPQSEAQAKIVVNANLVVLPVTVKDRSGELVPDLHKDEFRIFEDSVEQSVDVFTAEAFPLSMVVLIDNDLKDKDAEQVRASLDAVVGGMSLNDEAFVCRFDQFFHPGKGFIADQDRLVAELKRTNLGSEPNVAPPGGPFNGPTINNHTAIGDTPISSSAQILKGQPTKALDDAVYAAAQLLHDRGRSRRKIILLISDGIDGGKKFNTFTYRQVVNTLLHDNIAVYSVALSSAFFERKLFRLADYARDSGGDIYYAAKRDSLEQLYSRITEQARLQYTLAYVPRGTDRGADYHSVEVRVRREGLTIKTREGYFTGAIPVAVPR
jgi:Ca-activated chloride channel family protein